MIYKPLYNGFVFLLGIVPGANFGIAVILTTVLARLILLPASHKSVKSQRKLKTIQPEIEKIKNEHKKDRQEQARKTMELYKQHGINPLSGCLPVLIQIPVVLALFFVFARGFAEGIDPTLLYSTIIAPTSVSMYFLGIDLAGKSAVLALIAGATQYFL